MKTAALHGCSVVKGKGTSNVNSPDNFKPKGIDFVRCQINLQGTCNSESKGIKKIRWVAISEDSHDDSDFI